MKDRPRQPDDLDRLIARTRSFRAAHGMGEVALSHRLFRNGTRLGRLESGACDITVGKLRECNQVLDELEACAARPRPGWRRTTGWSRAPGAQRPAAL